MEVIISQRLWRVFIITSLLSVIVLPLECYFSARNLVFNRTLSSRDFLCVFTFIVPSSPLQTAICWYWLSVIMLLRWLMATHFFYYPTTTTTTITIGSVSRSSVLLVMQESMRHRWGLMGNFCFIDHHLSTWILRCRCSLICRWGTDD